MLLAEVLRAVFCTSFMSGLVSSSGLLATLKETDPLLQVCVSVCDAGAGDSGAAATPDPHTRG